MSDGLENRLDRLEYRQDKIFQVLRSEGQTDSDAIWTMFTLENDLNANQEKGICDVLNDAHNKLEAGESLEEEDFEQQLSPHIPEKEKPDGQVYDFIQRLLGRLTRIGQWNDVCERFRPAFNVRPRGYGVKPD